MKKIIFVLTILFSLSGLHSQEFNAVYYNQEGWKNLDERKSLEALKNFKLALSKNGEYKEARVGLGYAYLLRKAYADAFDIFQSLTTGYPDDEQVIIGKAHALSGLNQYDEALALYTRAAEINGENIEAKYGTALIYYRMNKPLWAERAIDEVLKINPYHYDTLLLESQIKYDIRRLDDAEEYIKKAINVRREFPDAYVSYGYLLLMRFSNENNPAYIADARREGERAVSINPGLAEAQQLLGIISLIQNDPTQGKEYFTRANKADPDNTSILYNLAYCSRMLGDRHDAEEKMLKALTQYPDDPMMNGALEHFYIRNNYAFGNPGRLERARHHYRFYQDNSARNLSEYGLLHLRRSILLNPMDKQARRNLADYYKVAGYNRLYIDQLKDIQRLHPAMDNREELDLAVIKRRDLLYSTEGYAQTMPPRDVVRLVVLPFDSRRDYYFYDGGSVFSNSLSFALQQFGRMEIVSYDDLVSDDRTDSPTPVTRRQGIDSLASSDVNYIVTGDYSYSNGSIEAEYRLINNQTGAIDTSFTLQEEGKESLNRINFRGARRIFDAVPVRGRVLKLDRTSALVNLGSFDDVKENDLLYTREHIPGTQAPRKILLRVSQTDTFLSRADLVNELDFERISKGNQVFRLKRRRARLLE